MRLRQRDLALESLEDRRLLSAALLSDPILQALANERPPTADVAIVHLDGSPGAGFTAGEHDPAVASAPGAAGGQTSLTESFPGRAYLGSISMPARQPGFVDSPSLVDATFAAGLNPVAGDSGSRGRVSTAGAADLGSAVPDGGAFFTAVGGFLIDGDLAGGGGSSSANSGDSRGAAVVPDDSGSGSTVAAQGITLSTVPAATAADAISGPQLLGGNQASDGTGDASGTVVGATTNPGTGTTASSSKTDQGIATGDQTAGDLEWPGIGTRRQLSDGADPGGTSDATSGDDTGTASDGDSTSSGNGGHSSGKTGTRTDPSQSNDQADSGDQTDAADGASSTGASRRSGGHGGRVRGERVAEDPTDQGPAGPDTPDESATNAGTSFPGDFAKGAEPTGGELQAIDPADDSLVAMATDQPVTRAAGTAGRHHHLRAGPFFAPNIAAADLNYGTTDWCQASDGGMDPSGGYFQQTCDFTTKVSNLGSFRPDGLARADKAPALGEKTDWRSLGSQMRGASGPPVLIGWGSPGAALSTGEGTAESLDLVYNFQAAATVRGPGLTGIHHVPARAANRQNLGLGDRNPAPAGSVSFFATRSVPPVEAGRGHDQGSWQAAVATAETDSERIEHLVAGSFAARHLNSDGASSGDAQRLDGRGWWGIVGQFVLAPQFPHNHQPTIMLAVADEPSRDALNVALVKANFLVLTAATAREAMKLLRTPLSPVDVALLDVHLPDVNGVDLCSRLRELYPTLPVLVCTDQAEHGDVNQLQKLNVLRIFSKPVAIGELLAAVKGIVS